MHLMFIDESGDHNLDPAKVDPTYPLFVLIGCIFDEQYYKNTFVPNFQKLKKDFFGSKDVILHTLEMARPHKSTQPAFHQLVDEGFRIEFYTKLNQLIKSSELVLVACVIKKIDHFDKYGFAALDPYLLSFDNLINRFIFELPSSGKGRIIAERRNDILDNQLELAWLNIKISGTKKVQPSEIKRKVEDLYLVPKESNESGLQLADLIANPIGRKILGKPRRLGHEVDFEVLKSKFQNYRGKIKGYGLSVIPKNGGPHSQSPI